MDSLFPGWGLGQKDGGKLQGNMWDFHVPPSCSLISTPGAMEQDEGPAAPCPDPVGWEWDIWPSLCPLVDRWEHLVAQPHSGAGDTPMDRGQGGKIFNGSTEEMGGEFWRR